MTSELVLSLDAPIDLQTHTILSDGEWTPEQLVRHFVTEGFALAAITDHDRVDTVNRLQNLAHDEDFHLLIAAEMTTTWRGGMVDILCYGFDVDSPDLFALTQDILRRQRENTRQVYDYLYKAKYISEYDADHLNRILTTPSAQHVKELLRLIDSERHVGTILKAAGFSFATHDASTVVDVARQCGAVTVVAHPGRGDGFVQFDANLLDEFRQEIPIDGLEVYYPLHSAEQTTLFRSYADKHDLLISAGSDSHSPEKPPIKYPAGRSHKLLQRLGIEVKTA